MAVAAANGRHARWPWLFLGLAFVFASTGSVFIVSNDESVANQVMPIVAFTACGAVGALILTRDVRNRVGAVLLWAAVICRSRSVRRGRLALPPTPTTPRS